MTSHGGDGDGGGGWQPAPGTLRVGELSHDDDDVTLDNDRFAPRTTPHGTVKNWSPGGNPDGPVTLEQDAGTGPVGTPRSFATDDWETTTTRREAVVLPVDLPVAEQAPAAQPSFQPMRTLISEGQEPRSPASAPVPLSPMQAAAAPPVLDPQAPGHAVQGHAVQGHAVQGHAAAGHAAPVPVDPAQDHGPPAAHLSPHPGAPPMPGYAMPAPGQAPMDERPPWEEAAAPRPASRGKWLLGVGAVLLVGVAGLAAWARWPEAVPADPSATASASSLGSSGPPPTATAAATAPPESVALAEPAGSAEPAASAASAEPATSAEPEASSEPASAGPAADDELAKPLSYEGYLTVESSVDAEVYVQGKHVGATNRKLVARCYQRFVRLKSASGSWITPGQPVRIACLGETTVRIDPTK